MKLIALLVLLAGCSSGLQAQSGPLAQLPAGRYNVLIEQGPSKWDKGDLLLLDDKRYLVTGTSDTGTYRASFTAQRIFFISGYLRGAFARLARVRNQPAIELPLAENSHNQLAATNLTAVYHQ